MTTSVLRLGLNLCTALYSIYWIRHLDASDLWISYQATANKLALIVGYTFNAADSEIYGANIEGGLELPAGLNWDLWLGSAPKRPYVKGKYHPNDWKSWLC